MKKPENAAEARAQRGADLWAIVTEFGERARANPGKVERAIRAFLGSELARHHAASEGVPCGDAGQAMRAAAVYRGRMEASEPKVPSLDERLAFLSRVHDLVVAEDRDGDRRESRRPLAPALDGLLEVAWALLVFPEDLARMRADLERTGSCRAAEYLAEVRQELPLPGEAGQRAGATEAPQ